MYEVFAVRYGTVTLARSEYFAAYASYATPDKDITLDYYFWVARNAQRTVIIDTGFDPATGIRRGRTVICEPRDALELMDVDPESITQVVLTHFHYDHIGNVSLFPRATFITAADEFGFWTSALGAHPVAASAVEAREVLDLEDARSEGRVAHPGESAARIPGLVFLDGRGHTPGHLMVEVSVAGGVVLLAADAAHSYEEYEQDMPFHIYTDLPAMYARFAELRKRAREPGVIVVPGHDPGVMSRFRRVAGRAAPIAVQLA